VCLRRFSLAAGMTAALFFIRRERKELLSPSGGVPAALFRLRQVCLRRFFYKKRKERIIKPCGRHACGAFFIGEKKRISWPCLRRLF